MIQLPAGTKVWIAAGVMDLRRGFDGPKLLLRFSQSAGAARNVCDLNTFPDALGFGHEEVLLSSGDVVSLFTGAIIRQLAFPMKNYPESVSIVEAGE